MGKVVEIDVKCSRCGHEQTYHSYNKSSELKGDRRMDCKRCGKNFKVLDQRLEKMHNTRKKKDRPWGWQKYSKS